MRPNRLAAWVVLAAVAASCAVLLATLGAAGIDAFNRPRPAGANRPVRITINDGRPLAVAVIDPGAGLAYDWSSGSWGPFDPKVHLRPVVPVANLPPAFATLRTVAGMDQLLARPDAVAVVLTVDVNGQPIAVVDCYPSPAPFAYPTFGGFSR